MLKNLNPDRSSISVVGSLSNDSEALSFDGQHLVGSTSSLTMSKFGAEESEPFLARNAVMVGLGQPSPVFYDVGRIMICGNGSDILNTGIFRRAFHYRLDQGYQFIEHELIAVLRYHMQIVDKGAAGHWIVDSLSLEEYSLNRLLPLNLRYRS